MSKIKFELKSLINEADSLLADASAFTILSINNPLDEMFDKMPGKGYYLTALAAFTVLGLYSKIYFLLTIKNKELVINQINKDYAEILELIESKNMQSSFKLKKSSSLLPGEEICFSKLMHDLKEIKKLDLGLKDNEFGVAWKQIRNMIVHMTFPSGMVGGKHILSTNKLAIDELKLPIFDMQVAFETIRSGFMSNEAFYIDKSGLLMVNSTILLAYLPIIKQFLVNEIRNCSDDICELILEELQKILNRQNIKIK